MPSLNINNVNLSWLGHSSFKLEYNGLRIYIDPFKLSEALPADIIFITHGHFDHCSVADIAKIVKEDTIIVTTPDTVSNLASKVKGGKPHLVNPGDKFTLKEILVEAIPAYNINKHFHAKENGWVGYILTINKARFLHTGDSDVTPELEKVKADVIMLPVGGTYTMTAVEAATLANKIMPRIAIPMHYGSVVGTKSDAEKFKNLCKCQVAIL
ncbi:MAG: MBL fold metallo-hydrolase [archaeon]